MSAVAAGLCLSFSSCTNDYESFNRNPNGVTKDETQRDAYAMRSAMLNLEGWVIPLTVVTLLTPTQVSLARTSVNSALRTDGAV